MRDPLGADVPHHPVNRLAEASKFLGHDFARPGLLAEALTHRSAAGARGIGSNERLEFIGDRVLGLIVAEWLIERFPQEPEGKLGPRLAALVSKPALAAIAEANQVSEMLNVAPGEVKRGVHSQANVLADALEAMIGALFLDAGLERARLFVHRVLASAVDAQATPPKDPKTALQEWALKRALPLPNYQVISQSGPSHAPNFVVSVTIGEVSASASAGAKRAAEQEAAQNLLGILPK
ncbi:ribonuclease III [Acidocella sp.]|uniref:ribonuclease III n=1 Tax=Acidocella sp. TaxID=50710 RepID=UPI0038CF49BD